MKCNVFYIGESARTVKIRISEHINNILRFGRNLNDSLINIDKFQSIALLFNESFYVLSKDFRFYTFESDINNTEFRKSIQADLIILF